MKGNEKDVFIVKKTKGNLPIKGLPFVLMKREVLGKRYELDLIFVSSSESKKLNNTYRNQNKPTNILSFSLSKKQGQIVICPSVVNREYKDFHLRKRDFIAYLFIHGLLHLEGYQHGSKMETEEKRLTTRFLRS